MVYKTMKENARKAADQEAFKQIIVDRDGSSTGGVGDATEPACVGKRGRKTELSNELSPSDKRALRCSPLGLLGVQLACIAEILKWDRIARTKLEEACWDNRLREQLGDYADDQPASETQKAPWDAWDDYINTMDADKAKSQAACAAVQQKMGAGTAGRKTGGAHDPDDFDFIPAMPCIPDEEPHREKLGMRLPVNACVARPVSKQERVQNQKAQDAVMDEWKRLQSKGTWHRGTLFGVRRTRGQGQ